jgi:hypothetical protein
MGLMEHGRWFDRGQPQTLQGATILCYINAVFAILAALGGSSLAAVGLIQGVAAYGMANGRRWAYWTALVVSLLSLVVVVVGLGAGILSGGFSLLGTIISLAFPVVLVLLLLHPASRHYQSIWFH